MGVNVVEKLNSFSLFLDDDDHCFDRGSLVTLVFV